MFSLHFLLPLIVVGLIIVHLVLLHEYVSSSGVVRYDNYQANFIVTPDHIKPEWYFLFAYAILRCIPSKRIRVLMLVLSITCFYILSFTSINNFNFNFKSNFNKFTFILWCFNFILLTYLRGIHVIPYYVMYAKYFSIIYFVYVVLII